MMPSVRKGNLPGSIFNPRDEVISILAHDYLICITAKDICVVGVAEDTNRWKSKGSQRLEVKEVTAYRLKF